MLPVPLNGIAQPLLESELGVVSEVFTCARDIRLGMLDIPGASLGINGGDIFSDDFVNVLQHRIHSNPTPAGNVKTFPRYTRRLTRQEVRLGNILHVCKIPRLQPVSVNRRPAVLQNSRNKQRQYSTVLRCRILSRTEDVEVP